MQVVSNLTAFRCQNVMIHIAYKNKMAFHNMSFSQLSGNIRLLRYFIDKRITVKFSTSHTVLYEKSAPVKYSVNKASKIPIAQVIGLEEHKKESRLWYEKYVISGSVFALLVYFCIIRKENDIDEILKGNLTFMDPKLQLLQLKTQLKYCENNKLPTAALKAKIAELEEIYNKPTPVFPK